MLSERKVNLSFHKRALQSPFIRKVQSSYSFIMIIVFYLNSKDFTSQKYHAVMLLLRNLALK